MRALTYLMGPALALVLAGPAPAQTGGASGSGSTSGSSGTTSGGAGLGSPLTTNPATARDLALTQSQSTNINSPGSQLQPDQGSAAAPPPGSTGGNSLAPNGGQNQGQGPASGPANQGSAAPGVQTAPGSTTLPGSTSLGTGNGNATESTGATLLANPDVTRTLGLTQTQFNSLNAVASRLQQQSRSQLGQLGKLAATERDRRRQQINDKHNQQFQKEAAGILSAKQMARYRQLELQARGPGAFDDPEIQKKLALSARQRQQMKALRDRFERQLSELRKLSRNGDTEAGRRVAAYHKQFLVKANDLLDPAQRRTWRELIGEDFNFQPPSSARRGR